MLSIGRSLEQAESDPLENDRDQDPQTLLGKIGIINGNSSVVFKLFNY